ncbi:MAG: FapA family protein [Clostridiales bacterium]|nr:FapA family protein [Clostridiales bacterium]
MEVTAQIKSLIIETTNDKMEAWITINGFGVTEDEIRRELKAQGVVYGINDLSSCDKPGRYLVAKGTYPTPSSGGELIYHFDTESIVPKPTINGNGTVNFHNLGSVLQCKAGDVLVTRASPKQAQDGMDVFGNVVATGPVKPIIDLPAGENTRIAEDGSTLIATADGRIKVGKKISIVSKIVIDGDVNNATGDVIFCGEVEIKGGVRAGFTVKAGKNARVNGVVEGATIESGGDIVIKGGVCGGGEAKIIAAGAITAKFLESCKVIAQTDINADSILHSAVKCGGVLTLAGRKAALVGGKTIVRDKIVAETIGSLMSTPTEVNVGNDPQMIVELEEMTERYNSTKTDYDKVVLAIDTMSARGEKYGLTDANKQILVRLLKTKITLASELTLLHEHINRLRPLVNTRHGIIQVGKKIYYGVKVMIGSAVMLIKDDLTNCRLTNVDGQIKVETYSD